MKDRLSEIMNKDQDLLTSYLEYTNIEGLPENCISIIKSIGRPR